LSITRRQESSKAFRNRITYYGLRRTVLAEDANMIFKGKANVVHRLKIVGGAREGVVISVQMSKW
jgi:hypothetical protein